jgi:formate-dependent nitrite reductase cytochrome c552 subunit
LLVGVSILLAAVLAILSFKSEPSSNNQDSKPDATIVSNDGPDTAGSEKFFVSIRKPSGPPRVYTGQKDLHGNPVTVSCATCHATRQPNPKNRTVEDLNEFHGNLNFGHGTISCLSCHNPNDYDALKLADGTRVEYTDVMTLCAQCHGPQMRDYQHNAHGGYNGFWDLSRGGQTKNNCVDCHNPHAPQFPKMQPTFKPRDRFLDKVDSPNH